MVSHYGRSIALHHGNTKTSASCWAPDTFHLVNYSWFFYKMEIDHWDTTVRKNIASQDSPLHYFRGKLEEQLY